MRTLLVLIWISFVSSYSFAQTPNNTKPYEQALYLEREADVACLKIADIKGELDPPHLLESAKKCVENNQIEDALNLMAIIKLWVMFDIYKTVHLETYLAKEVSDHYVDKMDILLDKTAQGYVINDFFENSFAMCERFKSLPVPNYFPHYILKYHDPNYDANLDNKRTLLVDDFDEDTARFFGLYFFNFCSLQELNIDLSHSSDLGCINIDMVKEFHTPREVYGAVDACLRDGDVNKAVNLFLLMMLYTEYDGLRTGHDTTFIVQVLVEQLFSLLYAYDLEEKFMNQYNQIISNDVENRKVCQMLTVLNPPIYYPEQVGLRGSASPILQNFDAQKGWSDVVMPFCEKK